MPATGAEIGTPASISDRQPPQTEAIEDVADHAHHVGELLALGRHHLPQGPLGERAVADLATAGRAHELHLADAKRREVVVQHEAPERLAGERLDALLVLAGAQGRGDQRLGLAAGKDGRAVRAGQNLGLHGDLADLVALAAADAQAGVEHHAAHVVVLEVLDEALDGPLGGEVLLAHLLGKLGGDRTLGVAERLVALLLLGDGVGGLDGLEGELAHALLEVLVRGREHEGALGLAVRCAHLFLRLDFGLDRLVGKEERLDHVGLGDLLGAALDHHDRVLGGGDDEVEIGGRALLGGRVGDELAVDAPNAHAGDRSVEGDVRQVQRRGGRGDRVDVGLVDVICGDHRGDNLRLVEEALGEQRPQ